MEECDEGVASELSSETLQALLEFDRKQGAVSLSHVTDLLLPEEEEEEVAEMPSEDWVTVWLDLSGRCTPILACQGCCDSNMSPCEMLKLKQ